MIKNVRHLYTKKNRQSRVTSRMRGFTLIEMLAVATVMIVLSGVILRSNYQFGGKIQLESLAYDIGLSIRQAQVYGIAVSNVGGAAYKSGYGIHFETSSPNVYFLFVDRNNNGLYDSSNNELVQSTTIQGGYKIAQLCVTPPTPEDCSVAKLDILFKRPEPDALIRKNSAPSLMESTHVILTSLKGDQSSVTVWANGQISVTK